MAATATERDPFFISEGDEFFLPPEPRVGVGEAIARGGWQGGTLGYGENISAAFEAARPAYADESGTDESNASPVIPPSAPGDTFGERYTAGVERERARNAKAKGDQPVAYWGSALATGIPAAAAGASAPTLAGRLGGSAAVGAVSGVGYGNPQTVGEGAFDAGFGAVTGLAGQYFLGEKLFPWLSEKLGTLARNAVLHRAGLTRAQVKAIAKNEGIKGTEEKLDEIYQVLKERVGTKPGLPERAEAAFKEAGENVAGYHAQADALGKGVAPALASEVDDAALAQLARQETVMGKDAWASLAREADDLAARVAKGEVGFETLHRWAVQLKNRLYDQKGNPVPGVDADQMRRFIQTIQEAGRARAMAVTPANAPRSTESFTRDVRDYNALSELYRMSKQQVSYETGFRGTLSKLNHLWELVAGQPGVLSGASAAAGAAPKVGPGVTFPLLGSALGESTEYTPASPVAPKE